MMGVDVGNCPPPFATMAKAEGIDEISELNLDNAAVSSEALAHLIGLPIKSLSLSISSVTDKGLEHIAPIYEAVQQQRCLQITYHSFKAKEANTFTFHPALLKEFRNLL